VMLWDRGTWSPEVDDVDAALKKGDLKFTLNGFKLKGSWVLVRTSGRYPGARGGNDARSWLLIKHRDDWAGELDITTFAPRSVKSEGDFADILGEKTPAIWKSNRPAKGGDAGAMFARIIEQAEKLKTQAPKASASIDEPKPSRARRAPRKTSRRENTKTRSTSKPARKKTS
jgi:bifunctional non-homologous end joining protein LigD